MSNITQVISRRLGSSRSALSRLAMSCLLLLSVSTVNVHAQINDSPHAADAAFPQFGFSVRWPDNWRVTHNPTASDMRFVIEKLYEPGRSDEGAYCVISVQLNPSTQGADQAIIDRQIQAAHPSAEVIETLLHNNGGTSMKVYNPGVYPLGGHPSLTYELSNETATNAGATYSYALVSILKTPGRDFTTRCQSVTKQDGQRAYSLFEISSQSILGIVGSLTLLAP